MRLLLAIRAFFAILFGTPLPDEVTERVLTAGGAKPAELPEGPTSKPDPAKHAAELEAARAEGREGARKELEAAKLELEAELARREAARPKAPPADAVAVRALAIFQSEGRLLDFLSEEIDGYSDAEIGAAVREIHRGCGRALRDHFKLEPVRVESEESRVTVPEGYDPAEIRLVGNVVGRPPFSGTLKHKGWRAVEVRLPNIPEGPGARVITPAEVEV